MKVDTTTTIWRWESILSPNNDLFAVSGQVDNPTLPYNRPINSTIAILDVRTGNQVASIDIPTEAIVGLAFSLDGKTLAAVAIDDIVRIWSISR